jgi:hypothetical protein
LPRVQSSVLRLETWIVANDASGGLALGQLHHWGLSIPLQVHLLSG